MVRSKEAVIRKRKSFVGRGGVVSRLINRGIDKLPFEAHLPGYNFCGPGTRLTERLHRGDRGINPLDEACKLHDIAYSTHKDSDKRREADKELAERAWARVKASDAKLGEKAAAWLVTNTMKAKSKIGGGSKKRKRASTHRKGKGIKRRVTVGKRKGGKKKGGVLPLLPIFAGLSALGSLAGGAAGVAKVVTDNKNARRKLAELKRHNLAMEGKGLYLRPYKSGGGGGCKKRKKKSSAKKKKFRFL